MQKEGGVAEQEAQQESIDMTKQDFCNGCGTQSVGGAIQIRVPIQLPEGEVVVLNLPLLACVRCGNTYMPRTFISQIMKPKPQSNILTPEKKEIIIP